MGKNKKEIKDEIKTLNDRLNSNLYMEFPEYRDMFNQRHLIDEKMTSFRLTHHHETLAIEKELFNKINQLKK